MAYRLIIDEYSVYEIDEECECSRMTKTEYEMQINRNRESFDRNEEYKEKEQKYRRPL